MKFKTGVSGNPSGRPKGSGDKRSELRGMLDSRLPEVLQVAIEKALDGDMAAVKLVIDKRLPNARSDSENLNIDINKIDCSADLEKIIEEVMFKSLTGDLPDDQGKTIAALTKTMSELHKLGELEERIKLLEGK